MDEAFAKQILDKTRADYDAIAESWNTTRSALKSDTMEFFASLIHDGVSVLDVGCGNGRLLDHIGHRPIHYTGVDTSSHLITIAQARYPERRSAFVHGDILQLPFLDQSFDALAALSVLHHIPSHAFRQQAVRECFRVLKPDGLCFISNWNQFQPSLIAKHKTWKALLGVRERGFDRGDLLIPWKRDVKAPIMRYIHVFRKQEVKTLLTDAGFVSVDVFYSRHGRRAHWWNGHNSVAIAKK